MHELSIAISIIDGVEEAAEDRGGLKIEAVHVKLGALSGVDKDALAFSYQVACEGTSLEGSRLVIEHVPLLMYCPRCCAEHSPPSALQLCCPHCLTSAQDVIQGRELEVTVLEIAA